MNLNKIITNFLLLLGTLILFYTYFYLPKQNTGSIKVEKLSQENKSIDNKNEAKKNIFKNTEYKNQNSNGQIFTTKANESYFYKDNPDFIYLINPYSFTQLQKDKSLIEINSNKGFYDKEKKIVGYEDKVIIKNKNYLITSKKATHFSSKNLIIIEDNVNMKDLTNGLSHIIICDILEINTITNNSIAYMKSKNKKVISKKIQ